MVECLGLPVVFLFYQLAIELHAGEFHAPPRTVAHDKLTLKNVVSDA